MELGKHRNRVPSSQLQQQLMLGCKGAFSLSEEAAGFWLSKQVNPAFLFLQLSKKSIRVH